jgi:hypothetical protein
MARAKLQLREVKPKEEPVARASKVKSASQNVRPDRANKRTIAGHFAEETHRKLRILAAERGVNTQELLSEALDDLFAKYSR